MPSGWGDLVNDVKMQGQDAYNEGWMKRFAPDENVIKKMKV